MQLTLLFVKVGITSIVPTIVVDPLLLPMKAGIFPIPFIGKPIVGLEFVHENEVFDAVLVKVVAVVLELAQIN